MLFEEWSYFEALYFCFISFTTIGYGDFTITTFGGAVIFIIYALLGIVATTYAISVATELWSVLLESRSSKVEQRRRAKSGEAATDAFDHSHQLMLSAFDALDQQSSTKQLDVLCHFVGITRLYHSQLAYHLEDCEDALFSDIVDSPRFKAVERYHAIVTQLLKRSRPLIASKIKHMRSSGSYPDPSPEICLIDSTSESLELLRRRSSEA